MSILFITSSPLGDAILSTGLLEYAQQAMPGRPVVVAGSLLSLSLFEDWPGVERRLLLQRKPWAGHWGTLWRETVTQTWDWIIDLRGSGFAYTVRANRRWIWRSRSEPVHQVEKLGKAFGLTVSPRPVLHASQARRHRIQSLLPQDRRVIAVAPAAQWASKEWPQASFVDLLTRLISPQGLFPEAQIAVFAAAHERAKLAFFLEHLPQDRVLDFVGKVSILDIFVLFQSCAFFVGNDSGLMHLAAASGVPTLGLFGPTSDRFYGPYSPFASGVRTPEDPETLKKNCQLTGASLTDPSLRGVSLTDPSLTDPSLRGDPCLMTSLSVDKVEEAVKALWHRVKRSPDIQERTL